MAALSSPAPSSPAPISHSLSHRSFTNQTELITERISRQEYAELHRQAAFAIYHSARPFTMFQSEYWKSFIGVLRPGYTPPGPEALAGSLLDECYSLVKEHVTAILAEEPSLGICLDETTNTTNARIMNLFMITSQGPFFQGHVELGSATADADMLAELVQDQIQAIIGQENTKKITSFSTDTCSVMRSLWVSLERNSHFPHALYIPCDSHSLQLLIKDILMLPEFTWTAEDAKKVVSFFKKSPKQYARLRDKIDEGNNKKTALIGAVITRWGSQFGMIDRLLEHREALRSWAFAVKPKEEKKLAQMRSIKAILLSSSFWDKLDILRRVIKPIHTAQVDSEGANRHLGLVYRRWLSLRSQLGMEFESAERFGPEFNEQRFWDAFDKREQKQLRAFHYLAFYLDPTTITHTLHKQEDCYRAITDLTDSSDQAKEAQTEFVKFRAKISPFYPALPSWIHKDNPLIFWESIPSELCLKSIARRLYKAIANSVFSERGFSTMKLIHSTTRNRLKPEKVSKLCYIHINQRVLDRSEQGGWAIHKLEDKELAEFEQEMGYLQESGYYNDFQSEDDTEEE